MIWIWLLCLVCSDLNLPAGPPPSADLPLVELFTSEGCSSCPSADRLLAEQVSAGNVVALAYHVDYWNRLGWTDRFSDARYSARQRAYAAHFGLNTVYTPQMVVNGSKEFVGGARGQLQAALHAAKGSPARKNPVLSSQKSGSIYRHSIRVDPSLKGSVLYLATCQQSAQTRVGNGENHGKTLHHVQVVIDLQEQKIGEKGLYYFETRATGIDPGAALNWVTFIQDPVNFKIQGLSQFQVGP